MRSTSFFLIAMGLLFFFIGIGLIVWIDRTDFPFILFKGLFPTIGLTVAFFGYYTPTVTMKNTPELITFHNQQGAVGIHMHQDDGPTGYIRYDEIELFDIYVESRSNNNAGKSGTRHSTYYYHVYLRKKDGGEWYLTESGSRKAAEEILEKINQNVRLTAPYTIRATPVLSEKIEKEETHSKTILRWKNKASIGALIFLIVFSASFLSILSSAFSSNTGFGNSFFPIMIIGFMLIIFTTVIFVSFRKWLKEATTQYCLIIDNTKLEYQELSRSGVVKKAKSISLKEVYSIAYSFVPVKNKTPEGLHILTLKDAERMKQRPQSAIESLKELFSRNKGIIQLDIRSLNPVEYLQAETWLQGLIKKRGNQDVL